MELRYKDPYSYYLFQNETDKTSLLAQHELDVASFYGKHSGIKTEKYYTGEALLGILKSVFTHKKFEKFIKQDKESEQFYTNNCKLLENEIGANNFNAESVFAIITNYLTMTDHIINQSKSGDKINHIDPHLDTPEIIQKIRDLFGVKLRSLDKMKSHYLLSKILTGLLFLILVSLICIIGACLADWYQIIDFSKQFTILAPFIIRTETNILQITTSLGSADLIQSLIMILISAFLLILLLIFTVFSVIRLQKKEKLDYKIHYLSRIIGESAQKLRETGWL